MRNVDALEFSVASLGTKAHLLFVIGFAHDDSDLLLDVLDNLALVLRELPCANASLEDFVHLLERPALHLRDEEVEKEDTKEIRSCPDVGVLGALEINVSYICTRLKS